VALEPAPAPFTHPGADRGGPVDLPAARRILAVRADNIGDVVVVTPALRALRAAAAAQIADAGLPVLVAGSDRENALVGAVAGDAPGVRGLPPVALPVFTALLRRAAVALTNNSGGMHLAEAVRTPVAVTFAGTERTGEIVPRGVPTAVLDRPMPCSPCRRLSCPYAERPPCLDMPAERVAEAALRLAHGHIRECRPSLSAHTGHYCG